MGWLAEIEWPEVSIFGLLFWNLLFFYLMPLFVSHCQVDVEKMTEGVRQCLAAFLVLLAILVLLNPVLSQ